ncbi:unnamed protein product [Arctia plantaginis]|uniref:Uncharacterized protein n=1 Tax=Arctia plantaginis TaxID=874455 RepID=A0A8S0ZPJ6_ARCPL|nr:unnamed protein product [Arctia plantaginis]
MTSSLSSSSETEICIASGQRTKGGHADQRINRREYNFLVLNFRGTGHALISLVKLLCKLYERITHKKKQQWLKCI